MVTIRDQLDRYVEEKYRIDPELLPFSHENYAIYRHKDTGRWFDEQQNLIREADL